MSSRVVIVSNRVPPPPASNGPWPAGGLVSALLPALMRTGDAMWFGWSGSTGDPYGPLHFERAEGVDFVTLDLDERQLEDYYAGFCNQTLWPALHGIPGSAPASHTQFQAYRSVNRWFAAALFPLLRADDVVWVHDYHLIPLGQELRRLGWDGPIGFFNHTPIPDEISWSEIPHAGLLASVMHAYDVIGVQTALDAYRLADIVGSDAPCRIGIYPAAIDPQRFRMLASNYPGDSPRRPGDPRRLMLGVDRLDYTKGIHERLRAFEQLLEEDPALAGRARLVQWAAPSREEVPAYRNYRRAVEDVAERINRRFPDLRPVELEIAPFPPDQVAAALQSADICVVTSIADGMNLVAKEFSAVHSGEQPGVLILSDTCGASAELTEALTVSGNDVNSIKRAMRRAIDMPPIERRRRSAALREAVDGATTHRWYARFVSDLGGVRQPVRTAAVREDELVAS